MKNHESLADKPPVPICVNKIQNRVTFKIAGFKCEYYLQLLTPKAVKLLGNTEKEITKNKNGENVHD